MLPLAFIPQITEYQHLSCELEKWAPLFATLQALCIIMRLSQKNRS